MLASDPRICAQRGLVMRVLRISAGPNTHLRAGNGKGLLAAKAALAGPPPPA